MFNFFCFCERCISFSVRELKFELKYGSPTILLFPCINKLKETSIGPNSSLNFFVNLDQFCISPTNLVCKRGIPE